mgnify:CR=1 FL=1
MTKLPTRPPLQRAHVVAANIRVELAARGLETAFFAVSTGASISRTRDVLYGREPATVTEIVDLADALDLPIASFFEGV